MKSCGQSCIYQNGNFIPSSDSFDIVVHMENIGFSQKSALKNIRLGSPDSINRYRMSFLAGEMFMIGCFLITGLYGLFLFFKDKSEKKCLSFHCFALLNHYAIFFQTAVFFIIYWAYCRGIFRQDFPYRL